LSIRDEEENSFKKKGKVSTLRVKKKAPPNDLCVRNPPDCLLGFSSYKAVETYHGLVHMKQKIEHKLP